mmetsp:Transcript_13233/g.18920  ORF Transcript_13233/g.18920 Transcript_13233/m.18920 type:complete len:81 (-) Transcript_13233:708-950(-)
MTKLHACINNQENFNQSNSTNYKHSFTVDDTVVITNMYKGLQGANGIFTVTEQIFINIKLDLPRSDILEWVYKNIKHIRE